jgi:hypothetical protein
LAERRRGDDVARPAARPGTPVEGPGDRSRGPAGDLGLDDRWRALAQRRRRRELVATFRHAAEPGGGCVPAPGRSTPLRDPLPRRAHRVLLGHAGLRVAERREVVPGRRLPSPSLWRRDRRSRRALRAAVVRRPGAHGQQRPGTELEDAQHLPGRVHGRTPRPLGSRYPLWADRQCPGLPGAQRRCRRPLAPSLLPSRLPGPCLLLRRGRRSARRPPRLGGRRARRRRWLSPSALRNARWRRELVASSSRAGHRRRGGGRVRDLHRRRARRRPLGQPRRRAQLDGGRRWHCRRQHRSPGRAPSPRRGGRSASPGLGRGQRRRRRPVPALPRRRPELGGELRRSPFADRCRRVDRPGSGRRRRGEEPRRWGDVDGRACRAVRRAEPAPRSRAAARRGPSRPHLPVGRRLLRPRLPMDERRRRRDLAAGRPGPARRLHPRRLGRPLSLAHGLRRRPPSTPAAAG